MRLTLTLRESFSPVEMLASLNELRSLLSRFHMCSLAQFITQSEGEPKTQEKNVGIPLWTGAGQSLRNVSTGGHASMTKHMS